ncbi:MAG: aminomethyltransferase family protein [Planctomycetota bacterium]
MEDHRARGAEFLPYGPPDAEGRQVEVPEAFNAVELEYAAIRKSAALLDEPHRGVVEVRGADRIEFLNNMITQELKDLETFACRPSFWLNRKGRIDADILVVHMPDRTLFDLDVHTAAHTAQTLTDFIFAEDAALRDATEDLHRMSLHGPGARALLASLCDTGNTIASIEPGGVATAKIAGAETIVARCDQTGECGMLLFVPAEAAPAVYASLIEAGAPADPEAPPNTEEGRVGLRPIGWHAFNVARIEHGTPLFNLDFGGENLPAETGVLDERVSFTKGCYLGQEVVARMHALGKPKQKLVGLRFETQDAQPFTGCKVFAASDEDSVGDPIGSITSSTLSPLLGAEPIAFASVRTKFAEQGTQLIVEAEGARAKATVQPSLRFWPTPKP